MENAKRINIEKSKPRNVRRVFVEVDVSPQNGSTVVRHRAPQGTHILELYVDDLPKVASMVRTEVDAAIYAQAEEMCARLRAEWERDNASAKRGKTEDEWRRHVAAHCNHAPEQSLALLGRPRGLPPLTGARVVAEGRKPVDLDKFAKLAEEAQLSYTHEPPRTLDNAGDLQAQMLANAIAALASGQATK